MGLFGVLGVGGGMGAGVWQGGRGGEWGWCGWVVQPSHSVFQQEPVQHRHPHLSGLVGVGWWVGYGKGVGVVGEAGVIG